MGNYHPESSSIPRDLGSSPIRQLPSDRFIHDWATASVCIPRRETPTRESQYKYQTLGSRCSSSIGQLPLEGSSQLSSRGPSSAAEDSPHLEPYACAFWEGKPPLQNGNTNISPGIPSAPRLKSSLLLEISAFRSSIVEVLLHSGNECL